jgi:cyclopropane fatty-acyl-phospholipid synthase-like methyltransferase
VPIERAKRKAAERGVSATFLVKDAMTLKEWTERFDTVIDSGLFHVFSDEDRRCYVEGLATVLKPGGTLILLCFSDEERGRRGRGENRRRNCTMPSPRAGASSPSSRPGPRSGLT